MPDRFGHFDLEAESVREFVSGVDDLDRLNHDLSTLVKDHDEWQQIDDHLHWIEPTLTRDTKSLEKFWSKLNEKTASLYSNSTEKWAISLERTSKQLNTAIAEENPSEIRIRFEDYRWQISDRFYRVDEALKDLCCTDLPKVGESLSPVIKMMEVSP